MDEGFLGEEEEDDYGDGDDGGHGHEGAPGAFVHALELLEGDGEGVLAVVLEEDERIQEVAPLEQEHEQGGGGQGGFRQRQDDAREDAELVAAVDARGRREVLRNAHEELPQQEDVEGHAEEGRHDQGRKVPTQPILRYSTNSGISVTS